MIVGAPEEAKSGGAEDGVGAAAAGGGAGNAKAKRKALMARANAEGAKGTMLDAFVSPAPAAAAEKPPAPAAAAAEDAPSKLPEQAVRALSSCAYALVGPLSCACVCLLTMRSRSPHIWMPANIIEAVYIH